jgi:hypothetical protein
MPTERCPRCGERPYEAHLHSLLFPIQICRPCANEEAKNIKAKWATHPDIASYEQEKGVPFKSIRMGMMAHRVEAYFNSANSKPEGR